MAAIHRPAVAAAVCLLLAAAGPPPAAGEGGEPRRFAVTLEGGRPLVASGGEVVVEGTTDAPPGSRVEVTVGDGTGQTEVSVGGRFRLAWPRPLPGGSYPVRVVVRGAEGGSGEVEATLLVEPASRLPRRPLVEPRRDYAAPARPTPRDFAATPDRWRIAPPPYELLVPGRPWDPYDQNTLKGDRPILGQRIFLAVTAVADTLADGSQVPTASGVSARRPGSLDFFGEPGRFLGDQLLLLSADLFRGDTAFRPLDWRVKATVAANLEHLAAPERGVVEPDVREGVRRTRTFVALEELFAEAKLADLSPHYDFLSIRAGIQPFTSDFRGFIFRDTNLGVRFFGNYASNRWQYNLAFFDRLEKDTNSGLNTFGRRRQQVAVANLYRQDFLARGYTAGWSLHYLRDEASFHFDENGFLARPDPVGSFTPHEVEAFYVGWVGAGHVGRLNVDHALYGVFGRDSLNPIAGADAERGPRVDVRAGLAALELSVDRDWLRPRLAFLYATGDGRPTDRTARGFDAIFDAPSFAGGAFSYWNRLGLRLAGTGVGLVQRGSPLPSLKSSREEGQPNFVNPGLVLLSAGLDAELTPRLRAQATLNYLRFDRVESLELLLFQSPIGHEIGWDLSLGVRYRPLLSNNVILEAGVAGLLPGGGFRDIYARTAPLAAAFTDLRLAF